MDNMLKDYILGGVADAHLFAGDNLFCDAITTLTDSGLNVTVSAEEIRGGKGAALLGRYFHSTGMTLTLTNATFNIGYLAASVGAEIDFGAEIMNDEQVKATNTTYVVPTKTPIPMTGCNDYMYAWYKKAGESEWQRGTIEADVKKIYGTFEENENYCIKYFYADGAGKTITVKSDFVPNTYHLILDANLYAVGDTAISGQTHVGKLVIDVPAFQLNGTQDLTMNMTGNASINLEGNALAVATCDKTCTGGKYYARISQVIFDSVWTDGVTSLVVAGEDALSAGDDLTIYAIRTNAIPQLITKAMFDEASPSEDATSGFFFGDDGSLVKMDDLKIPSGASAGTKIIALKVKDVIIAKTYVDIQA